jgi:hypothetical protein
MRLYVKIAEQKQAGAPWQKRGLEMLLGSQKMMRIAELLEDTKLTSNKQRAVEFQNRGYGSRSTFYELLKAFKHYDAAKADNSPPPSLEKLREGVESLMA